MPTNQRILFLTRYADKAASTRHRFMQFFPALQNAGFDCTLDSLFSNSYLESRFIGKKFAYLHAFRGIKKRLFTLLTKARGFDLIVVHCEIMPFLPAILESYLNHLNTPYLLDFDDAFFHKYDQHTNPLIKLALKNKYPTIIRRARVITAGSEYLAEFARQFNNNTTVLPTVIDLDRYGRKLKTHYDSESFTVGWIGSPSTAEYLSDLIPPLKHFVDKQSLHLILVGSGAINLNGIQPSVKEWSQESEVREMMQFDVGIMPLPDTPWARGKCGFKLIQYMACGLPVIASPVGVNCDIVKHGVNGFLAKTHEEWYEALSKLKASPELRARMGAAGREQVEQQYSTEIVAPKLVRLLRNAITSGQ